MYMKNLCQNYLRQRRRSSRPRRRPYDCSERCCCMKSVRKKIVYHFILFGEVDVSQSPNEVKTKTLDVKASFLSYGIASADPYRRLFEQLSPAAFERSFNLHEHGRKNDDIALFPICFGFTGNIAIAKRSTHSDGKSALTAMALT